MNEREIFESFTKFGIAANQFPSFTTPHNFAKKISKCSILKEGNTYYSSSACDANHAKRRTVIKGDN